MLCIRNATVLTPEGIIPQGMVLIMDGRILYAGSQAQPIPPDTEVLDALGMLLAPGFIELQLNGGFGFDFTQEPESLWRVAAELPRFGVTAFLPTIITSPIAGVAQALQILRGGVPTGWQGATPLGAHLEGPMLNPGKKGAHNPTYMLPPSLEVIEGWSLAGGVRLVTLAPEIPGALEVISALRERGITVSAGHSMASYDEARVGFAAGITKVTHLFNAMPPIEARAPGLAGAALGDSRVVVGIIPDGVHVHPAAVRLAWRAKGRQGLVIVTDSMAAMGMPPGQYILGDYPVTVDGRAARLANNTLAGSMITMDQAVRNLATWCEVELHEAVLAASQTPAEVLGLDRKGYIQKGADADLILLDHAGAVQQTYIGGSLVYQANKEVNNFNLENSQ